MIEKYLLHRLLNAVVTRGGLRVNYWDGTSHGYGPAPEITVDLCKPEAAWAVLIRGSRGVGEAYVNGDLLVEGPIEGLVKLVADNHSRERWLEAGRKPSSNEPEQIASPRGVIPNYENVGLEFYRLWLDESMTYSCAYFLKPDDTLEQAQHQNRQVLFRKLQLGEGMRVLDLGSGWGSLLIEAAKQFRVQGIGISPNPEESEYSNWLAHKLGVDHLVRFSTGDFRDLAAAGRQVDRVVSVGMYEHIGRANQRIYFDLVAKMLKPDGLSVLQTVCANEEGPFNPWIEKYVFPGGYIPSCSGMLEGVSRSGMGFIAFEDLTSHYVQTFLNWQERFETNAEIVRSKYGERFARLWRFYLGTSLGAFRCNRAQVAQLVFGGHDYVKPLTQAIPQVQTRAVD